MKDKRMSIRLSFEDWQRIHDKAESAKMSLTDYILASCLGKKIVRIDGLEEVIRQQKGIGRNLNQLTTLANMGKVHTVHLEELTEEYCQVNENLSALLRKKV